VLLHVCYPDTLVHVLFSIRQFVSRIINGYVSDNFVQLQQTCWQTAALTAAVAAACYSSTCSVVIAAKHSAAFEALNPQPT
jgi:hypothetical protein